MHRTRSDIKQYRTCHVGQHTLDLATIPTRIMFPTDSTHLISQLTRPFQNINLNDSSSSPDSPTRDSLSIVQSYHSNLPSFPGAPATLPGYAIDCTACRSSIIESEGGEFLVCDGCELGFHIDCIGMRGREVMVDEWLCCECSRKEVVRVRTRAKGDKWCPKNKLVEVNGNELPHGDGQGEDSRFSRYLIVVDFCEFDDLHN